MDGIQKYFSRHIRVLAKQPRDARYAIVFLVSVLVFLLTYLQALSNGLFDSLERPVFEAVNRLPHVLYPLFYAATQLGGLGSMFLWIGAAWYLINRRAALSVASGGLIAWFVAKLVKVTVQRGRPGSILTDTHFFAGEKFTGYGFPSGHSTFSAACATVLYYQVSPRYRKYILLIVVLVGLSRMFLGAHFPLDIVGGWALGATIGSIIVIVTGVSSKGLTVVKLKKYLKVRGYDIAHLKFANVDARGSRPFFMTMANKKEYFGKIFGKNEHAADWLFKIYRFFRYKNLQAEEPYVNSRRNIELEAFATLWAKQAGVRVVKIIDTIRIGKIWVLIQEKVPDAVSLTERKVIKQKSLEDAWRQVKKLHASNMAHRDLRAANLMVDKKGQVWIIDFGFAEVSPNKQRLNMDMAELLMSMTLLAGVKRTLDSLFVSYKKEQIVGVLPYLQSSVFSGATTKQIKKNKSLLQELKSELSDRLSISDSIDTADIDRLNHKKLINFALLGAFLYVVVPQFNNFKDTLKSLTSIHEAWLVPIAISSILTYILTGIIYVILADVPIKVFPTVMVQLAASFMTKVIPAGLGSTTLNGRYLTKAGLDPADSSALLVAQGAIGFIMFAVPLAIFLTITGGNVLKLIHFSVSPKILLLILFGIIFAVLVVSFYKSIRARLKKTIIKFISSLRDISTSPIQLSLASISSLAVTIAYIFCLFACFKVFGLHLGIVTAVIIYATATIAKSTIPTPGGLGPLEVAMVSGLIGFGIDKPTAFSVVIMYRLATFWLPIPFSLLAYKYITKRRLV